MIKQSKGMTLVSLIVTIIILLILAGVAIASLGGENGLISRVTQAKKAQIKAEMKEKLVLALSELQLEKNGEATLDDVTQEWADNKLKDYEPTITNDASTSGKKVTMSKSGIVGKYIIDEKLNIVETEESDSSIEFSYDVLERVDNKVSILIHVRDRENGLTKIEFPDIDPIIANGTKEERGIDYNVEIGTEYRIKIISESGEEREETILITDYWYNITKNLGEGIEIDNKNIKTKYNEPYEAILLIDDEYLIQSLTVKMGEDEITTSENNIVDKTTGRIYIEKVTNDITINAVSKNLEIDFFVSTNGNDNTGDGSKINPYATVKKAIEMSNNGDIIYIMPGVYELEPMYSNQKEYSWEADESHQYGITDKGKNIEIFGKNNETILIFDAENVEKRDGIAIGLYNKESIIRNLTYIFRPKSSANNYSRGIFNCMNGTVENLFFRISGENKAIYVYGDSSTGKIINCTFFHDLNSVDSDFGGACKFYNIATNVNITQENTNVIIQPFGNDTLTLSDLINQSKSNEYFNTNKVGVFYGEYSW